MIVEVSNETFYVPDGTYTAEIKSILGYSDNTKALVKLELETGEVLVKTYDADELGAYPWNSVFKALNTTDTDDLVGHHVELEIKNAISKKTGHEFANIKKIRLIDA
ncbi:MAG: hypothetical protein K5695_08025 [Oscillospiraceae bacterium]|nr:hypothetical protein [Oscillospiraceae bacterium]